MAEHLKGTTIMLVGEVTDKPDLVVCWPPKGARIAIKVGHQNPEPNLALRIQVGHRMHKEMAVTDLNFQLEVLQAPEVRIKNDWSW